MQIVTDYITDISPEQLDGLEYYLPLMITIDSKTYPGSGHNSRGIRELAKANKSRLHLNRHQGILRALSYLKKDRICSIHISRS